VLVGELIFGADGQGRQPAFLGPRPLRQPAGRPVSVRAEAAGAASLDGAEAKQFMGIEYLIWSKILPLGFIFFCILFNYTILRDTKVRAARSAPAAGLNLTRAPAAARRGRLTSASGCLRPAAVAAVSPARVRRAAVAAGIEGVSARRMCLW